MTVFCPMGLGLAYGTVAAESCQAFYVASNSVSNSVGFCSVTYVIWILAQAPAQAPAQARDGVPTYGICVMAGCCICSCTPIVLCNDRGRIAYRCLVCSLCPLLSCAVGVEVCRRYFTLCSSRGGKTWHIRCRAWISFTYSILASVCRGTIPYVR